MAFYLIILLGILLVLFNYNVSMKEKKSFNNVLNHEIDNMDEFKVVLEENNREFRETIFELQREVEDINTKFNLILNINNKNDEIIVEKVEIYDKIEDKKTIRNTATKIPKGNSSNNVKISEIKDLLSEGLSIEDIARRLNMGKGEVLLIKELYLK